jgi:transcriptional regulator with XRE-family HTH domain
MNSYDESVVYKKIGHKLKELRIKANYTSYEDFAMSHELSSRYYWAVEKGKSVSISYLIKLLNIHNVSLEEFFKDFK